MSLLKAPGLNFNGLGTNSVYLTSGETWLLGPEAGFYNVVLARNHSLQYRDPVSGIWQGVGSSYSWGRTISIYSDGVNYRIANQTGCAVGALLTNAGSAYTSAPSVTASAGGSTWKAIMGYVVSTTVVVTNSGTNYSFPPIVLISAPPAGGLQATGYATLSGGAVSGVTISDQGAGYLSPPTITFMNDPREANIASGYGAAAAASLTGGGTVNAVVCLDHGGAAGALTSLPTLTFSGGGGSSAAATVIMNWMITAYAAGTAGAGLAGSAAIITALDAFPTTAPAYTNPKTQAGLVATRQAEIYAPITGGGITATGAVYYDGGCYTSSPVPIVQPTASVVTTAPVVTFTMGGGNGTSYVTQIG